MVGKIGRIRDGEDYLTPEEHKARTTAKRDELRKALLTPEPLNLGGLRVLIRGLGAFRLAPGHLPAVTLRAALGLPCLLLRLLILLASATTSREPAHHPARPPQMPA
jgi:hypothetical protein